MENVVPKFQLSANVNNGYLLLATTAIREEENINIEDSRDYFSLFMIFGYANGTDNTIDISYFYVIMKTMVNSIILSSIYYTITSLLKIIFSITHKIEESN